MMIVGAEELVAPGGPSAPVWAFFTAISLALIGVLAQQLKARFDLKAARNEASKAHESAQAAQKNTASISNGFAGRVDRKLDDIGSAQESLLSLVASVDERLSHHLEWHLEKEGNK